MNVRTVAFQSNLLILAFGIFAIGLVSISDYFLQSSPSLYSMSMLPDSSLLAMALGLMFFAAGTGFRGLLRIAGALALAVCGYTLAHNLFAGGSDQGLSWITGFSRTHSSLAVLGIITALAIFLAAAARLAYVVKVVAGVLICVGLLQALADVTEVLPSGLRSLRSSAEMLASLTLVLAGLALSALVFVPRGSAALPDKRTLVIGALSALIAVGSWQAISKYEQQVLLRRSDAALELIQNTFERVLQFRLNMVRRLGERWEAMERLPNPALWNKDAAGYMRDYPHLHFIALLRAQGPLYYAANDPQMIEAVERLNAGQFKVTADRAIADNSTRVVIGAQLGPDTQLVMPLQGVFEGQSLVLVAGLDLGSVIEDALHRGQSLGSVRVFRDKALIYGPSGSALSELMPVAQHSFSNNESEWKLELWVDRYTVVSGSSHLASWMLAFILLFGFLLMVSQRLGVLTRQRNHDLLVASEQLHLSLAHQREIESTLVRHQMLFQIAGQVAQVGGWLVDMNNQKLLLSDEVCSIHGIAPGSITTTNQWYQLFAPVDGERLQQALQQCFAQGDNFELKAQAITASGKSLWVRISGRALFADGGEIKHVQGALQDITEEVWAADNLDKLSRQMQNILESITDAFYSLDSQWRFQYVNPQAERLLQRPAAELVGANVWELFPDARDSAIYQNYHEAVSSNETRHFELFYPPLDSWFDITAYPADDGITVYFRDIGQRKRAEQELQQMLVRLERSNLDLQDFAFIASHDLQEPLRKIQAFGERLSLRTDVLDEKAMDYLQRMRQAAGRMQTLIQDLLALSRITTRGAELQPVSLDQVLDSVLHDLEGLIERESVVIHRSPLAVVPGDPGQLSQLLQNLITNAAKFQPDNQTAQIRIYGERIDAEHWCLCVQDNGIGFDEKYLDRIFNPFQRLHERTRYAGTGVGLAIVKRIVERHAASVTATSQPGQGTTFKVCFTLPVDARAVAASDKALT